LIYHTLGTIAGKGRFVMTNAPTEKEARELAAKGEAHR
jgi:hypothetical protein